jgi:sirohydrochlorin ferrochelatase
VLHLVCGVLVTDTEAANASLPTPDAQSTRLLSRAYTDIGAGANICYGAGSSTSRRNSALARLRKGLNELTEGVQRVDVAQGTN